MSKWILMFPSSKNERNFLFSSFVSHEKIVWFVQPYCPTRIIINYQFQFSKLESTYKVLLHHVYNAKIWFVLQLFRLVYSSRQPIIRGALVVPRLNLFFFHVLRWSPSILFWSSSSRTTYTHCDQKNQTETYNYLTSLLIYSEVILLSTDKKFFSRNKLIWNGKQVVLKSMKNRLLVRS